MQEQRPWFSKCNGSVWAERLYLAFGLVLEQMGRNALGIYLYRTKLKLGRGTARRADMAQRGAARRGRSTDVARGADMA